MKQLAIAIVAFTLIVVYVQNMTGSRNALAQNVRSITARNTSDSFYQNYLDTLIASVAAQVRANPNQAVSAPPGTLIRNPNGNQSAAATFEGDTLTPPNGSTVVSQNLNTTIHERRAAFNVDVVATNRVGTIRHHVILSIFTVAPFATLFSDTITSATQATAFHAATDLGGCAGTGSGCDPLATQTTDDARTRSALTCDPGVGSGTCPASNQYDDSTFAPATWDDKQ